MTPTHLTPDVFHATIEALKDRHAADPHTLYESAKKHWTEPVIQAIHHVLWVDAPKIHKEEPWESGETFETGEAMIREAIRKAPPFDKTLPAEKQLLTWRGRTYVKIVAENALNRKGVREYLVRYDAQQSRSFSDSPIGTKQKSVIDLDGEAWHAMEVFYDHRITL